MFLGTHTANMFTELSFIIAFALMRASVTELQEAQFESLNDVVVVEHFGPSEIIFYTSQNVTKEQWFCLFFKKNILFYSFVETFLWAKLLLRAW